MLDTAPDGLILVVIAMIVPSICLLEASYRECSYHKRMVCITVYQAGSAACLFWLLIRYGWYPVWRALGAVLTEAPAIGWMPVFMFCTALASPIVTALIVRNARRYPYIRINTPHGKMTVSEDAVLDRPMREVMSPEEFESYRPNPNPRRAQ